MKYQKYCFSLSIVTIQFFIHNSPTVKIPEIRAFKKIISPRNYKKESK